MEFSRGHVACNGIITMMPSGTCACILLILKFSVFVSNIAYADRRSRRKQKFLDLFNDFKSAEMS